MDHQGRYHGNEHCRHVSGYIGEGSVPHTFLYHDE
jgi:hypothetical protein